MTDAIDESNDSPFGSCPECGRSDGYRNVGREHWGLCVAHGTKWLFGSNLFSGWRDEGPDVWERNARELSAYRDVGPEDPAIDVFANEGGN